MSNLPKGLNDIAWEKLFEKYSIIDKVDAQGNVEELPLLKQNS